MNFLLQLPEYRYFPIKQALLAQIVKRDGNKCFNCGTTDGSARLHEIYGHKKWSYYRDHLDELKIACEVCNGRLGHKKEPTGSSVSVLENALESLKTRLNGKTLLLLEEADYSVGSVEMQVTNQIEEPWVREVARCILRTHKIGKIGIPEDQALGVCFKVGCDWSTAVRKLKKYSTHPESPFKKYKGSDERDLVTYKKRFVTLKDWLWEQFEAEISKS